VDQSLILWAKQDIQNLQKMRIKDHPRQQAVETGIRGYKSSKTGQYSLREDVGHIFVRPPLLHTLSGCRCALSAVNLSESLGAMQVSNANREVDPKAFDRNLEFGRCIAVGKETKCNAQVDDTLIMDE